MDEDSRVFVRIVGAVVAAAILIPLCISFRYAIPGYSLFMRATQSLHFYQREFENERDRRELDNRMGFQLQRIKRESDAQVLKVREESQASVNQMTVHNEYLRVKQAKQLETAKLEASIEGESGIEVQKIKNDMMRKQNELDLETNRLKSELDGKTEAVQAENKGRAEFVRAQQNRRIKVLEREAELEGAKLNAMAEIERARGVAKANGIIGESLKQNEAYLRWLWIHEIGQGDKPSVIYVPTEANLPILEAGNRPSQRPQSKAAP